MKYPEFEEEARKTENIEFESGQTAFCWSDYEKFSRTVPNLLVDISILSKI